MSYKANRLFCGVDVDLHSQANVYRLLGNSPSFGYYAVLLVGLVQLLQSVSNMDIDELPFALSEAARVLQDVGCSDGSKSKHCLGSVSS